MIILHRKETKYRNRNKTKKNHVCFGTGNLTEEVLFQRTFSFVMLQGAFLINIHNWQKAGVPFFKNSAC